MWDAIFGFGILCGIIFVSSLTAYYVMILVILLGDEYSSKKTFIKDCIPFYGLYRLIKNTFNSLGD